MRPLASLLLLCVALLTACSGANPEQEKLDRTFDFTVRMLRDVGRNPIAASAFGSAMEGGGTPVNYVVASAPENADFTDIVYPGPAAAWTVVIKDGPSADALVVEAYAEATATPARSETVSLRPAPRE